MKTKTIIARLPLPLQFSLLVVLFALFSFLNLSLGSVTISWNDWWLILQDSADANPSYRKVFFDFRIPKYLTAVFAGAALSVSGLLMQTLFRNPLAGPYVLGISSGASLGVAILVLGQAGILGISGMFLPSNWALIIAALSGSMIVLSILFAVSLRVKNILTILILGVLLGSAATAMVTILQYFSHESSLKSFIVWTMGSLGNVSQPQLKLLIPVISLGLLLAFFANKSLNALLLGETYAKSMGVNILGARILILLSTGILAGTITAFCGPIGFIGIAVPHITRMYFQSSDHRILQFGSILIGSIVLLISDTIAQLPGSDSVLPINSITALIGIPVVIYLIFSHRRLNLYS